jgi:NAD(P)-dependent dehydrogenase (short-subunit alcohol dehydrogenase family)
MTARTILITGANRSIGLETARQLAALGHRIWLGCRDTTRGDAAAAGLREQGYDVRVIEMDVTSDASVKAAAARVQAQDGFLDTLVNNAGIAGTASNPVSEQPIDDIKAVYETNVFGPIRTTQAFLPLLKAAKQGNVVMVSSGLGSLGWLSDPGNPFYPYNFLGYNTSKTALNGVALVFSKDLKDHGIKVNTMDPGYTATDFNNHTGYRTVEQAAATIVRLALLDADGATGGYFYDEGVVPW